MGKKFRKQFQFAGGTRRAANLVEFYAEAGYMITMPSTSGATTAAATWMSTPLQKNVQTISQNEDNCFNLDAISHLRVSVHMSKQCYQCYSTAFNPDTPNC